MEKRMCPRMSPRVYQHLEVWRKRGQQRITDVGAKPDYKALSMFVYSSVSINVSILFGFPQNTEMSRLRGDPRKH